MQLYSDSFSLKSMHAKGKLTYMSSIICIEITVFATVNLEQEFNLNVVIVGVFFHPFFSVISQNSVSRCF